MLIFGCVICLSMVDRLSTAEVGGGGGGGEKRVVYHAKCKKKKLLKCQSVNEKNKMSKQEILKNVGNCL